MNSTADDDLDGQNNGDEYISGTEPTDPSSYFHITGVANLPANGFVINWESVPGRVYGVYWTTNLTGSLLPLETNIAYPQNSYTDSVHALPVNCFYKIGVQMK